MTTAPKPLCNVSIFAKIYPEGSDAEHALHCVCDSQPSDYHQQFVHVKLKTKKVSSDTDSASKRSEDGEVERLCGYYTLSRQRLPRYVSQVWRLGRGSSRTRDEDRGVGLLIIGPPRQEGKGRCTYPRSNSIPSQVGRPDDCGRLRRETSPV